MKPIQTRTYKEEDDAPNCRRLSALDFPGEEMKGKSLSGKIVGLGTLFAIDSKFHVELLSNIWKTQHEELNSSQLYDSSCLFIVGKYCKCEIDSCGDKGNSNEVNNFGRDTVQGSHIETTFNICNCTIANKYTPKNILNLEAACVIASHDCNMPINNYLDYKFVVFNKLDYCSNLKNPNPLRSSPNFKFIKGDIESDDMVHFILQAKFIHTIIHFVAQTHVDHFFGNSFVITTRENNVHGTTQFSKKLIFEFIPLMMKGKSLSIHENASNVRSYLYWRIKIMEGYVSNPEWWGDVLGALLYHPRMLLVLGREGHFNVTNPSNLDSAHMTKKFSESWIAGLLRELCDKQNIHLENENGCLEQCSQFLADIQMVKSIHVVSTAGVNGRPQECHPLMTNYAICATRPLGNGIGFEKEDKFNFTGSFYYKIKVMVKEVLREFDNVVDIPNNLTILDELLLVSIEMATGNLEYKVLFPRDGIVMNVRPLNNQVNIYKRVNNHNIAQRLRQQSNTTEVNRGTRESQQPV
ncbi:hypothetical protein V6N12_050878 [Hibiscus sabdariffa]|uniref:NAD(P)-binding domain-containing protein n=1 Tax=Hibiscus sabdariffa TaxID=183260 RepID=A0ABR2GDQ0_9ROSI